MTPRVKIWVVSALIAVASGQAVNDGCPTSALFTPAPSPIPVAPEGSILVAIENQSGLTSVVEAVFLAGGEEVRRTTRLLTAAGIESVAKIIRTTADQVVITARIASPVSGTIETKYLGGFVLAAGAFNKGIDFEDRGGIAFIIPGPPSDCNGNGSPDSADIAAAASRDCDGNTIPDECESGLPTVIQCAGELVVPADAHGAGVVPNLTGLLVAVDTCTPTGQLTLSQDVPAGTPLELGHPVNVNLSVTDADANVVQCASGVVMVDVTAPVLICPGELVIRVTGRLRGEVPDMLTVVQLSDNCQAVSMPTLSQTIPAGALLPIGVVPMDITAVDGSGNSTQCMVTLRIEATRDPETPD
ncbi:MAG: hypothetical protein AABZ08_10875 [Planctomycetota bacterium]